MLDYSTIEVSNQMHHALLAGGPRRLTVAGRLGLPQVLCPGALEVLVFNEPETVPKRYEGRRLVRHSPQITDLRLNAEEMRAVGREIARRLAARRWRGRVHGADIAATTATRHQARRFHDPQADAAFVAALKQAAPPEPHASSSGRTISTIPPLPTEAANTLIGLMQQARAA